VLRSAPQWPRMNAYAERVVRTIRAECTDRMLIVGERPCSACWRTTLRTTALGEPTARSTRRAPCDDPSAIPFPARRIERRPVRGGLINEYEPAA